jgi:hypothetical protein
LVTTPPFDYRAFSLGIAMRLYFFPTLYKDSSGGHLADEGLFIRVSKKVKMIGYGEQWEWVKVLKVFPGIYESVGEPFFDIKDMFSKVR